MSKEVKPVVYIDDYVTSVACAREHAERAYANIADAKRQLWGLVMATPRDIAGNDDPVEKLEELFSELMDEIAENIVDNYKYSIVADDAEYIDGSLVKKSFNADKAEEAHAEAENAKRSAFFTLAGLNPYNMDDARIYDEWKDNKITLDFPLTEAERADVIKYLDEKYNEL